MNKAWGRSTKATPIKPPNSTKLNQTHGLSAMPSNQHRCACSTFTRSKRSPGVLKRQTSLKRPSGCRVNPPGRLRKTKVGSCQRAPVSRPGSLQESGDDDYDEDNNNYNDVQKALIIWRKGIKSTGAAQVCLYFSSPTGCHLSCWLERSCWPCSDWSLIVTVNKNNNNNRTLSRVAPQFDL